MKKKPHNEPKDAKIADLEKYSNTPEIRKIQKDFEDLTEVVSKFADLSSQQMEITKEIQKEITKLQAADLLIMKTVTDAFKTITDVTDGLKTIDTSKILQGVNLEHRINEQDRDLIGYR